MGQRYPKAPVIKALCESGYQPKLPGMHRRPGNVFSRLWTSRELNASPSVTPTEWNSHANRMKSAGFLHSIPIMERIEEAHERVEEVFEGSITDTLRQQFGEEEIRCVALTRF